MFLGCSVESPFSDCKPTASTPLGTESVMPSMAPRRPLTPLVNDEPFKPTLVNTVARGLGWRDADGIFHQVCHLQLDLAITKDLFNLTDVTIYYVGVQQFHQVCWSNFCKDKKLEGLCLCGKTLQ